MRAFWRVFLGDLLAGLMNYSYLCIVNEKRRNLRPNWATKITKRAGKCFLVKPQKESHRRQVKFLDKPSGKAELLTNNLLTIKIRIE